MKFEDTDLLDHPTVRKAYQVMRGFFSNGDDFAKQAVRAGEILSTRANNPDPDAIAACVLMDGMIIPYKPEGFEQTVSKQAAAYMQFYYNLNTDKPVYKTEGERQIFLAHSIIGLEDIHQEIVNKDVWKYQVMKDKIDLNETHLMAVLSDTTEQSLAQNALSNLDKAKTALADLVRTTQQALAFEKTGLPDHPTIRKAYELVRTADIKNDPLFTNKTGMGLDAAKAIIETGVSSDPDIIGAALLNQYWEKEEGGLSGKFSSYLIELYRETSPFSGRDRTEERSEEARIIIKAIYLRSVETLQQEYLAYKKTPKARFDKYHAIAQLENLEYCSKELEKMSQHETHAGLKARMEKALSSAHKLMYAPGNQKIRKPGSPRIDRWS